MSMYQSGYEREASQVWPSSPHQAVGNAVLPSCPFKETLLSSKMAGSLPGPLIDRHKTTQTASLTTSPSDSAPRSALKLAPVTVCGIQLFFASRAKQNKTSSQVCKGIEMF